MLQTVSRWRVAFKFIDRSVVLFIDETHWQNVLRTVEKLGFSESGLEGPTVIEIEQVQREGQHGVSRS